MAAHGMAARLAVVVDLNVARLQVDDGGNLGAAAWQWANLA
jgi:hypothetical protein